MKHLLIISFFTCLTLHAAPQKRPLQTPCKIKGPIIDCYWLEAQKTVMIGMQGAFIFYFKNLGDEPIIIQSVTATGDHTKLGQIGEIVNPGHQGHVYVQYLSDVPCTMQEEVVMRTNCEKDSVIRFKLKLQFVEPQVDYIVFDSVLQTKDLIRYGDGHFYFWFTNTSTYPLEIQHVRLNGSGYPSGKPDKAILPNERGLIEVVCDTKRLGRFNLTCSVQTNLSATKTIINVSGTVFPKPQVSPP